MSLVRECWRPRTGPVTRGGGRRGAAVRLDGVTKRFGSVVAVDEVDLEIRDGEFFPMLGPSGSGKTTCLRLIAGFETPTEGHVLLHGADVTDRPVRARRQHRVPGLRPLPAHDRGRERRLRPDDPQGGQGRAGLPHRRGHGASSTSGGSATAARAARAASANGSPWPAPSSTSRASSCSTSPRRFDLKLRQAMQLELKRIQREVGITFIYVTHDQEEALTASDRLAVFHEGRIQQMGTPAEVYDRPETAFVAGFVGVSNVLDAEFARELPAPTARWPCAWSASGSCVTARTRVSVTSSRREPLRDALYLGMHTLPGRARPRRGSRRRGAEPRVRRHRDRSREGPSGAASVPAGALRPIEADPN